MAKSGEDIEPYVSFDPATLSPEEYREYLALLDTTLHDLNDEYFSPRLAMTVKGLMHFLMENCF